MTPVRARRWLRRVTIVIAVAAGLTGVAPASALAGTIAGTAFNDANRDGVRQAGEAAMPNHRLYLWASNGTVIAVAMTDAAGGYSFSGLADGSYVVRYESSSWSSIVRDWVPTTTGSLKPEVAVTLPGSGAVDFGWRSVVRSTDLAAPISVYTGANGLRVESFDDVVPARTIYDQVMVGLVGAEAPSVTVRFDWGTNAGNTATSVTQTNGHYSGYRAVSYVPYATWVQDGDQVLAHEYGHAWSQYNAFMVQQDATFSAYLHARGLDGDARVGTSYEWDPDELIAEDYRQLFGSANAQVASQINRDIPLARDVPGLKTFLRDQFTTSSAAPPPPPPPAPAPLAITALSVTPTPVAQSAAVRFTLSEPARVTVDVLAAGGALVRTLVADSALPAGAAAVAWNRKDSAGRRVKSGSYTARVRGVTSDGREATQSTTFTVA